ncbi:MAG: GlsB/YeaQ/YmgE family stress response membrane protein [Thermoanaerobaculaceae bacterium]
MHWIISLAIGGLVGWLASLVMKTNDQMGCLANVLVGIGGSLLGYFVAGLLGIAPQGGLLRFAVAVGGAVLLIAILRMLGLFKKA